MTILYFTATGNGLHIAKSIGGKLVSIPRAMKEGNLSFQDDQIGLIFPIYGWAVPGMIREFLRKSELKSSYIFAVMSYGMMSGAAAEHLQTLALERGIRFSYINTIKMIDNYLPGFRIEQQQETEPKKQIEANLKLIAEDVNKKKQWITKSSFLVKFMTKQRLKSDQFKQGRGITEKFHIEDTCTRCGICAKVCPTDNIKVEGAKPIFSQQCITCLACTHNCPQNAIRLTGEKSKVRFRNPHVSIKEIIEANH